jgi:hypothetical protein
MTVAKDSKSARSTRIRSARSLPAADDMAARPRRSDWKRLLLVAGLGVLSWISTYMGMLELVQANLGRIDLALKIALGMSVAMLMLMIIWLLDQIFSPITAGVKMLFIAGYVFLTVISVGFGFGFYWKFLESRSEASRSAESAVTQVQSALHGAEKRLSQLITTLDTLTAISTQKAADEVAKGNSCPNSRPGDGPRRRLREAVRQEPHRGAEVGGQRARYRPRQGRHEGGLDLRQRRHEERVPARPRAQARHGRHQLQRVPHRPAAEAVPR